MSSQWMDEIKAIRQQMSDDFQFTAMAMRGLAVDTQLQLRLLSSTIDSLSANFSERLTQVEGRMRLMDQRFGKMMDAVESGLDSNRRTLASKAEVDDLRLRVEKLEQERPGA